MPPFPRLIRLASLFFLFSGIIACNLPQTGTTPDLAAVVAQTQTAIAVNHFLSSTSMVVPTTQPPPSPQPSSGGNPSENIITPLAPPTTPPVPSFTQSMPTVNNNCKNAAKFVSETIPDNSVFAPGQQFMKTWTLQNTGTCTWNPEYSLVHVRGEQMNGTSPSPIGQSVVPGSAIQLYLPQTAPDANGVFQGFWMLRSNSGQDFGIGQFADVAFWVKIQVNTDNHVADPGINPLPNWGTPNWSEAFEDKQNPWFLGTDSSMDYSIKDGQLIITALKPMGDQWRVAQSGYLEDFYLQARFSTGPSCSGKDGYGLIVRAPEKSNGNINSGMIFSFSCDGKYRIYRLDNSSFFSIQNWVSNPAIKAGRGQNNDLGIYAKGSEYQLFANGILVFQFTDTTYNDGLFGLMVRSESTNNFQVLVDKVETWNVP